MYGNPYIKACRHDGHRRPRMTHHLLCISGLALGAALSLAACKKETAPSRPVTTAQPAAPPPPNPVADARNVFDTRCVVCHGNHGAGDGPGGAALSPKPPAFAAPTR